VRGEGLAEGFGSVAVSSRQRVHHGSFIGEWLLGGVDVVEETIHHRGTISVRRLFLAPGETTRWHRDPYHRVTVVFRGELLTIEFRDGRPEKQIKVTPGQVDWDEPSDRTHRATNIGNVPYEEITVFFLAQPDDVPQPDAY
jgi:quercetin dioxygenase-like cupin family protein